MAKTTQVLKMCTNGRKFSVIHHEDDKVNPFWIYRHTWGLRECGYSMAEHKRLEVKYADMRSCLFFLANNV